MGNIRYKGQNYTRSAIPVLIEKEITTNGTYNAVDDGADGFSKVIVDVAEENNAKVISVEFATIKKILKTVDLPEGTIGIGYTGFGSCEELENITFPSTLSIIGPSAFQYCTKLKEIEIPSSVTTVGSSAFEGCSALEKITIHKSEDSLLGAPWGAPNAQVVWLG